MRRQVKPNSVRNGAGTLASLAERREVVQAEQHPGRLPHRRHVQHPAMGDDLVTTQRVQALRVVAQQVSVVPGCRGEARVEPRRGRCHGSHDDVTRQHPGQANGRGLRGGAIGPAGKRGPGVRIDIDMGHGAACVHPGIRAAGDGQPWRGVGTQHSGQARGEFTLDRAPAGLSSPPAEGGAVVGEIEA